MKKTEKALVLLSGGQDSTTCLAVALSEHDVVETICFDYGQRHQIEVQQAHEIARVAGVPLHTCEIPNLSALTSNSLTSHDIPITSDGKKGSLPSTFVPGRNMLFLTLAATYAYQRGIRVLYMGVCQTDYSGYPDCRETFIQHCEKSLNLAMETTFEVRAPLMHCTKAETIQLMQKLGRLEWYKSSHTCYEGLRPACGVCPACELRLKGFKDAGVLDPLDYRH
ncbi:7-cyano-7-deazaguanine synthase QueC [Candidatus Marinamargulisbacteria bacterium SCGC AG-439-L15]|nr:7-cyano-7-deazaguanine synthase QueC [Candidatus Marinamargulisbacteria bacterium SCGC AG-439-L15]